MSAKDINADFVRDARSFVAGNVTGVRSFNVTADGQLTGITFKQIWHDGQNKAECFWAEGADALMDCTDGLTACAHTAPRPGWEVAPPTYLVGPALKGQPHKPGTLGCSCGWWAYSSGDNKWGMGYRLAGVIAAWGVVTIGSLGFRAEFARPLAFVAPSWAADSAARVKPGPAQWELVQANYPSVAVFGSLGAALAEFPLTMRNRRDDAA